MDKDRPTPQLVRDLLNHGRQVSLQQLCLPHDLDAAAVNELGTSIGREIRLTAGETLYRQGQTLEALYVVAQGVLKTVLVDGGESDQITGFFFPRELLGLDALHDHRHVCTAIAIDESVVNVIPMYQLEHTLLEAPALRDGIERLLAKELTEHEELLAVVNQRSALERVAVFFFSLSCRLGNNGVAATEFSLALRRAEIANYLGLATETASRAIGSLRARGILSGYGKRVNISNPIALRNLAVWGTP